MRGCAIALTNTFSFHSTLRGAIEKWRVEYNRERPHSSLGNLTPGSSRSKQPIRELGPRAHRSASSKLLATAVQCAPAVDPKTHSFSLTLRPSEG